MLARARWNAGRVFLRPAEARNGKAQQWAAADCQQPRGLASRLLSTAEPWLALRVKISNQLSNRKDASMLKVHEIKAAIESLPEKQFVELRHWFSEKDWQKWDRQIEADTESGKLDFLVREALEEKYAGKLKAL